MFSSFFCPKLNPPPPPPNRLLGVVEPLPVFCAPPPNIPDPPDLVSFVAGAVPNNEGVDAPEPAAEPVLPKRDGLAPPEPNGLAVVVLPVVPDPNNPPDGGAAVEGVPPPKMPEVGVDDGCPLPKILPPLPVLEDV